MECTSVAYKWISLSVLFVCILPIYTYDEGGIVEGCAEDELAFGCKYDGTQVVVKEAWLHSSYYRLPKSLCHIPEFNVQFKMGSILQHINKKCASQKVCRFNLFDDVQDASKENRWKGSVIRLQYECVESESMRRACGAEIVEQEGWLHNAGYPKYYLGPGACTFAIHVDPGQSIELTINDLSLKTIVRPKETECTDRLEVSEGSNILFSECGTTNKPLTILSRKNKMNVTLHSGSNVVTKRGFVAYFKAKGCPTPDIPENGILIFRNAKNLQINCKQRHVFVDNMQKYVQLTCQSNDEWDGTVSECVDLEDLYTDGNITEEEYRRYNGSSSLTLRESNVDIFADVTIPCIVMLVMFVGNLVVVLMIRNLRKKTTQDTETNSEQKDNIELKQKLLSESAKV